MVLAQCLAICLVYCVGTALNTSTLTFAGQKVDLSSSTVGQHCTHLPGRVNTRIIYLADNAQKLQASGFFDPGFMHTGGASI